MGSQHQLVNPDLGQSEGEGDGRQDGHHWLCCEHPPDSGSVPCLSNKNLEW